MIYPHHIHHIYDISYIVYCLFVRSFVCLVCLFVRLRISPPRIELAASHFARRFNNDIGLGLRLGGGPKARYCIIRGIF